MLPGRSYSVSRSRFRPALLALGGVLMTGGVASAQRAIPTPESSLGFRVGDGCKLATYGESIRYFESLERWACVDINGGLHAAEVHDNSSYWTTPAAKPEGG